jgi:hypothetical protein
MHFATVVFLQNEHASHEPFVSLGTVLIPGDSRRSVHMRSITAGVS